MIAFFTKGLVIGFIIAAIIGPIGILCIQRSLTDGFKIGFMTGIGAALADGVYGLVAGFGLTAVSSLLVAQQFWIHVIGGLFLIYLGIKILFTHPPEQAAKSKSDKSSWHACATTFFLTLTNPMTILSFMGVFAGLGLGSTNTDYSHALLLVTGITLGSGCWWLLLSGSVVFILHHRISAKTMRVINAISGVIMLGFGIFALKM